MEFPKGLWVKNWVVNVGLIFDSLDGELYSNIFQQKLGKKLNNSIISYENGFSTNYLLKSELDDICQYLAQLIIDDIKMAKKWHAQLIEQTDIINGLMKKLNKKDMINYDEFGQLKESFYSHVASNFAVKKPIDYLPSELSNQLLNDFEKARLYTESVYIEFEQLIQKFLEVIGMENDYPKELIYCLTYNELEQYLKIGSLPKKQVLEDRNSNVVLWYQNGKCHIFTKTEAKKLKDKIIKSTKIDTIKGMVAYKGLAKGYVRIVFDPSNVKEFNKGDILVTGMTRPEFLYLMSKAAAFVTDSGGLLSHASISAREMKKPCIVGTENATKVLKDGDLVEVDATNGIVRIIKN